MWHISILVAIDFFVWCLLLRLFKILVLLICRHTVDTGVNHVCPLVVLTVWYIYLHGLHFIGIMKLAPDTPEFVAKSSVSVMDYLYVNVKQIRWCHHLRGYFSRKYLLNLVRYCYLFSAKSSPQSLLSDWQWYHQEQNLVNFKWIYQGI